MNRLLDLARKLRTPHAPREENGVARGVKRTCSAICAGAWWLTSGAAALAQGAPGQEQAAETPPYVVPYAVVILCIGLGVTIVLNSSKRRERAKPEVYGEPK